MCLLEQVSSSLGTVPVTAGPGWLGISSQLERDKWLCPGEVPDVMSDYNYNEV